MMTRSSTASMIWSRAARIRNRRQGDAQAPPRVLHLLEPPLPRLPDFLSANTLKAMGFKLTMVAGFSYLKSMVHKLPETNLENFYINRFGRKLYPCSSRAHREAVGRHPSEISADWGAQRVKGLSIMGVLKNAFQKLLPKKRDNSEVETSLIEEFLVSEARPGPAVGNRRIQLRSRWREGHHRRQCGGNSPEGRQDRIRRVRGFRRQPHRNGRGRLHFLHAGQATLSTPWAPPTSRLRRT